MNKVFVLGDEGLSVEDKAAMRVKFENGEGCRWCGGLYQRECPRVKHIIFNPSDERSVREVEFWEDNHWDRSVVIWPEDCI